MGICSGPTGYILIEEGDENFFPGSHHKGAIRTVAEKEGRFVAETFLRLNKCLKIEEADIADQPVTYTARRMLYSIRWYARWISAIAPSERPPSAMITVRELVEASFI